MKRCFVVFLLNLLAIVQAGPTSRIVGGQAASKGQFPYQVQIRSGFIHSCGGSIIDKRWILTAAHCIPASDAERQKLIIVVGAHGILSTEGEVYKPMHFVVHEMFSIPNNMMINYDIGLIRVSKDIIFRKNVQQIYLPNNNFEKFNGVVATLSGWGKLWYNGPLPNVLHYIDLKVIDQRTCNETWMAFDGQEIYDNKICTAEPGYGPCHGDSGGPLAINNIQIGIVSYGYPCATGVPSVFTRVSSYIDWINWHMYP